jgi:hypothetical protein
MVSGVPFHPKSKNRQHGLAQNLKAIGSRGRFAPFYPHNEFDFLEDLPHRGDHLPQNRDRCVIE